MQLHSFDHFLAEGVLDKSQIPAKFYVCINLKPDTYAQLADGVLPGVQGISSSRENFSDWLPRRSAMVVMDGAETVRLNRLSKVQYDNPHYLASKNLAIIGRLFNQSDRDGAATKFVIQLSQKLDQKRNHNDTFAIIKGRTNFDSGSHIAKRLSTERVRSVKDIRDVILKTMRKEYGRYSEEEPQWETAKLDALIQEVLLDMGEEYKYEAEWLVKDQTLRIPANALLYLARENDDEKISLLTSRYRIVRYKERAVEIHGDKHRNKRWDLEWKTKQAKKGNPQQLGNQLEEIKRTFFRQALNTYTTHLSEMELPYALIARAKKVAEEYVEKNFMEPDVDAIPYVSEWDLNNVVQKKVRVWVESMGFGDYDEAMERAFDQECPALENLSKRFYGHIRVRWHTLHPNEFPKWYDKWS